MDAKRVRPLWGHRRLESRGQIVGIRPESVAVGAIALFLTPKLFTFGLPKANADWMLLAVLALVAELLPVQFTRRSMRLTFSVPFLTAICVGSGPVAAWMTALMMCVAGSIATGVHGNGISTSAAFAQLMISKLAVFLASFAYMAVTPLVSERDLSVVLGAIAFALVHGSVRVAIPERDSQTQGHRSVHPLTELEPGIAILMLFGLLVVAAALLVGDGYAFLTPLIFGPILALRSLLNSKIRMAETNYQTVSTLALMLQRAHPYTHRHLERVAAISEEVAIRLGLGGRRAQQVHHAAVLHDIGKIAIDEDILDLPRKLTAEEFEHVKGHAAYGGDILEPVLEMREMAKWIRHHHERPDGRGYPEGLLDPEIPIESKIIAVVDAFDAMTGGLEGRDGRPFREPMPVDEALVELERCAGSQFDPGVVKVFREVILGGVA